MNTAGNLLRDFAERREAAAEDLRFLTSEELEDERLMAFERGYSAGWDDAVENAESGQTALSETFRQRVEDLGFTYHEAHSAMLGEVSLILESTLRTILPSISGTTLASQLIGALTSLMDRGSALPVKITVHSVHAATIRDLLADEMNFSIELIADDTVGLENAEMHFAEQATLIDTTSTVNEVLDALATFRLETLSTNPGIRKHHATD